MYVKVALNEWIRDGWRSLVVLVPKGRGKKRLGVVLEVKGAQGRGKQKLVEVKEAKRRAE
jgi:hypothetical protein